MRRGGSGGASMRRGGGGGGCGIGEFVDEGGGGRGEERGREERSRFGVAREGRATEDQVRM